MAKKEKANPLRTLIAEMEADMTTLGEELEDCMDKKVAGARARKLTLALGVQFKEFRKLSVAHHK